MSSALVQILLPLYDNTGAAFDRDAFVQVRRELADAFGGVTAHLQAPAEGLWEDEDGAIHRDRIVIIEVITDAVDRAWWTRYREVLETRFRQDVVVIRASPTDLL